VWQCCFFFTARYIMITEMRYRGIAVYRACVCVGEGGSRASLTRCTATATYSTPAGTTLASYSRIAPDEDSVIKSTHSRLITQNKARSHRPQTLPSPCRHLGSYLKRPKSSPVRPLACSWCYCAQFVAKPNAACALRFSWVATSSNLRL